MKSDYRRLVLLIGIALVSGGGMGCGGTDGELSVVNASGKVFLDDAPHGPAQLTLTPVLTDTQSNSDTRPTLGAEVQADGSFKVTTYNSGDGAPPGEYTVVLGAVMESGTTDPEAMMQMMSGGGGPSTNPLKVTIPAEGSTSLELKFTSTGEKTKPKAGPTDPIGTN